MFQLVYTSTASHPMTQAELHKILQTARTVNSRHGITGVLFYHRGAFFQVLEGEEDVVETVFAHIKGDRRHHDVVVLFRCLVGKREFETWSMNFLDTGNWNIQPGLIGYNSLPDFARAESRLKPFLRLFHVGLSRAGALA